jgi:hypothetical protein
MRIYELLFWNDDAVEGGRSEPDSDIPQVPFGDDLSKLANAFTRAGLVKRFWNLNGSEEQPAGSAPPDAEIKLIPSGALEPTVASVQTEPVETGPRQLVPFQRYRGGLGD